MEKKYLIVNTGSASKKYALYEGAKQLIFIHLEGEDGGYVVTKYVDDKEEKKNLTKEQFDKSLDYVLEDMVGSHCIAKYSEVSAIGIRIVAPGLYFLDNCLIDKVCMSKLEEAKEKAPLHLTPMIQAVKNLQEKLPGVPLYSISDSAFYKELPALARNYGLPTGLTAKFEIFRFGYHGLSVKSITGKIQKVLGFNAGKVIVCHLGGGVSVVALKDGKPVDMSMGFTPLEGLLMATRVGDIDPGAVLYLQEKSGMTTAELRKFLNSECGLLGVSEASSDVRDLLKLESEGNIQAKLALDLFTYRLRKYIGSYIAVLNGVDALIFSGTIGERSFIMRGRILAGLENLGFALDKEVNNNTVAVDKVISREESIVKIAVIKTDEMGQLARETERFV
ncbi:MAG: acetate/propionate family kinase [bacterium]